MAFIQARERLCEFEAMRKTYRKTLMRLGPFSDGQLYEPHRRASSIFLPSKTSPKLRRRALVLRIQSNMDHIAWDLTTSLAPRRLRRNKHFLLRAEFKDFPVLCLQAQGLGLRQFRRFYDLEVSMSKTPVSSFEAGVVAALGAVSLYLRSRPDYDAAELQKYVNFFKNAVQDGADKSAYTLALDAVGGDLSNIENAIKNGANTKPR